MNEENQTNIENSKVETTNVAPVAETPVTPAPVAAAPVEVAPVAETPATPAPVEVAPVAETPVAPVAETPVAPVAETPTTSPVPAATPVTQDTGSKKDNSTGGLIIAILLLVGAICFVVFMPYIPFFKDAEEQNTNTSANNNTNNATNNTTNTNTTDNTNSKITANDYAGIYTSKEGTAYLYTKDGKEVDVQFEFGDYTYGNSGEVKGGKIVLEMFDETTTISLSDDKQTLSIISDNQQLNNVKLTKSKNYSKEEYFEKNYGSTEYLTGKYSGQYTLDKKVLYLYQSDESTVRIANSDKSYSFESMFDIQEDGSLYDEMIDDKYKVTFSENKLTFETVEGEKLLDGTYTKTKDITIDDVMKYFIG